MVTSKEADSYRVQMALPQLVFRTPTNKEAIKKFLAPEVIEEMERQDAELEKQNGTTKPDPESTN